jgi:RHS repeat-associated protein
MSRTVWRAVIAVAVLILGARAGSAQTTVQYYHTDASGSVRLVTDQNGGVVATHDYGPFGIEATASASDPRLFAGKERDPETGFDYFGARYYASQTGRFTSPDPLGGHLLNPQTFNRYAYAGNNPLRFTDPTGLDFYLQCEGEGDTCHEGRVGSYVKSKFEASIITSSSLSDPKSGNSATVNIQGVMLSSAGGVHQGIFINGTPAADIQGSRLFTGFSFHIDHSELSSGVLSAGTATFAGNRDQAIDLLSPNAFSVLGWRRFGVENTASWLGVHPTGHNSATNLRFSAGAWPNLFDYGPSPHFVIRHAPGASVPQIDFHVDDRTGLVHACALTGTCR